MTETLVARLRKPWDYTEGKRTLLCEEAATELARLQAENEALRRERDEERDESMWRFWRDKAAALATKCDAEKAAREAAEAKAERLKEALEKILAPFHKASDGLDENDPGSWTKVGLMAAVRHYREIARAALEAK